MGGAPGPEIPLPIFGATDRLRGWVVALVITAIAGVTRFWNLTSPTDNHTPVFDEKHYVPQAWQVLTGGNWIEDNPGYGLIVHPPVGKWFIAIGEWMFGYSPLGWRFMSAVVGTLMVLLTIRIVRRMSRSTMVGAIAGILLTVESVTYVSSRVGLLDIFQAFLVLVALSCLLADRDQMRERMYRVYIEGRIHDSPLGPRLGFRWWRFGCAIALGLGCGVKWSGIYVVLAFLILSLAFDVAGRKAYHVERPWKGTLLRDVVPSFASLAILPMLVYLATYIPWFNSETAVYRFEVGRQVPDDHTWSWIPGAFRSLWYYEIDQVLKFHENLTNSNGNHHPWESKPWTWPMSLRPMLYAIGYGPDKCGGSDCVHGMYLIGSPIMWWLSVPVLLWGMWRWLVRRDWRYAVVMVCYLSNYLPWFMNLDRQMYFFYATSMAPFLVMGLALILGDILGADGRFASFGRERRTIGILIVTTYMGLCVVNFVWLWPILTGYPVSQEIWNQQLWLPSWR